MPQNQKDKLVSRPYVNTVTNSNKSFRNEGKEPASFGQSNKLITDDGATTVNKAQNAAQSSPYFYGQDKFSAEQEQQVTKIQHPIEKFAKNSN